MGQPGLKIQYELPIYLNGYDKILDLLLSTYGMNLMNSCMNSLQVLAEEVTFAVCCVCVATQYTLFPAHWGHPIFLLPVKRHDDSIFGHVTLTYNQSILWGLVNFLKGKETWWGFFWFCPPIHTKNMVVLFHFIMW